MGLHICYDLHLPGTTPDAEVRSLLAELRARALVLPFDKVTPLAHVAPGDPVPAGSWTYEDLSDYVRVWAAIVSEPVDPDGYPVRIRDRVARAAAVGFVVRPGTRCEAATFGLAAPLEPDDAARARGATGYDSWHWHFCCKTQYASLVSDDHLIRCHTALVSLLEEAERIGIGIDVRDQTGYWATRNTDDLLQSVREMNRIVARFAGAFSDAVTSSPIASTAEVQAPIFDHPDFERLEAEKRESSEPQ